MLEQSSRWRRFLIFAFCFLIVEIRWDYWILFLFNSNFWERVSWENGLGKCESEVCIKVKEGGGGGGGEARGSKNRVYSFLWGNGISIASIASTRRVRQWGRDKWGKGWEKEKAQVSIHFPSISLFPFVCFLNLMFPALTLKADRPIFRIKTKNNPQNQSGSFWNH